jgi:pimeloyl-ACP methyl ester carboxylesterase
MSGLPEASEGWTPMDPSKTMQRPSPIGIPAFADRATRKSRLAGFQRDGFHGPLNIYRGMEPYFDQAKGFRREEDRAASFLRVRHSGRHDQDARAEGGGSDTKVPNLKGFLHIEGVGHWPQLEASEIVNEALVGFLR